MLRYQQVPIIDLFRDINGFTCEVTLRDMDLTNNLPIVQSQDLGSLLGISETHAVVFQLEQNSQHFMFKIRTQELLQSLITLSHNKGFSKRPPRGWCT